MSSHPGVDTVEGYVSEAWTVTQEQEKFICKVYNANKECKEYIESFMENYDEEDSGSWRDYRNMRGRYLEEDFPNEHLLIEYFLKFGAIKN